MNRAGLLARLSLAASLLASVCARAEEWDDPKPPEALGMRAQWFHPDPPSAAPATSWSGDDSQFNPNAPERNKPGAGHLATEAIKEAIHPHLAEVKFCFAREQDQNPALAGRVIVRFVISESGAVTSSEVESSTVESMSVERCMVAAVRRWSFPPPKGGSMVVTYPFKVVSLQ